MAGLARTFGLTGGIASGKSTVARCLADLGAKVIDVDVLGHQLLQPQFPAHQKVVEQFGSGVLDPSGNIDRKKLGALVFADREKLRVLNTLLHPLIIQKSEQLAEAFLLSDPRAVVIVDAALIYEAGLAGNFARVIVVWCRPEQQIARLTAKTGMDREAAERRIAAQMTTEEKRRRADYAIDCSGTKNETRRQVQSLYPELQRIAIQNQKKMETGN